MYYARASACASTERGAATPKLRVSSEKKGAALPRQASHGCRHQRRCTWVPPPPSPQREARRVHRGTAPAATATQSGAREGAGSPPRLLLHACVAAAAAVVPGLEPLVDFEQRHQHVQGQAEEEQVGRSSAHPPVVPPEHLEDDEARQGEGDEPCAQGACDIKDVAKGFTLRDLKVK
eukprot:CAMPEP_0194744442 /NCGR_PEP_ID=MMETSP0296-20130528/100869_1 /TAXON_ID=39354 /ORGANISM="Heterosigma akashiwo, Strain CCMP2393" /LENGTH=176 /DNA_ID=CAMNT_0039656583 /DNA_START=250 /DNA_END=780 /DNA_ORIENTATION=-